MASSDDSYTDNESGGGSTITNVLKGIQDGNYIHLDINERNARLKMRDRDRQAKSEWKGAELSANRMVKCLHKLFKTVAK